MKKKFPNFFKLKNIQIFVNFGILSDIHNQQKN